MCKIVVNQVNQFSCRIQGYELYETKTGEIVGMTEKDIAKAVNAGETILGLALDSEGKVVLDSEQFFQNNIMVKTTLTNMHPFNEDCPVNILYTVIGLNEDKYILINSRFGRSEVTKNKLSAMLEIGLVQGGAKLHENGEIEIVGALLPSPTSKDDKKAKAETTK